ncbi:YqzE-like protein [Paenibacillus uliginis N3/975]|uniref:YqzE-like protein n=1 Tax=Paenibacillus uliginis N3/975 TaxID=1313296 RepID=A0A1X7H2S7_9BACL|nr:YqzE family protein [Paenibacillus uliginis]SMF78777.1 YqzE-like protein [Paenibacillus uliginis N3/975]
MANSNDLIKYITERVVTYIDTPKEDRKRRRGKEPWTVRWFGMIPFSVSLWKDDLVSKKSKKRRAK